MFRKDRDKRRPQPANDMMADGNRSDDVMDDELEQADGTESAAADSRDGSDETRSDGTERADRTSKRSKRDRGSSKGDSNWMHTHQ